MTTRIALTSQTGGITQIGSSDSLQIGAGINSTGSTITLGINAGTTTLGTISLNSSFLTLTADSGVANGIEFLANGTSQQIAMQARGASSQVALYTPTVIWGDITAATTISWALDATGATSETIAAAVTSFILKQADLTTNSGTGAALTIQAQNETGTTSTGGALVLQSGSGTSTNGNIQLKQGTNALGIIKTNGNLEWAFVSDASRAGISFDSTAAGAGSYIYLKANATNGIIYADTSVIRLRDTSTNEAITITPVYNGTTSIQFTSTVTSSVIKQADLTTNSGTGANLTIQAQNETGTTSIGGALILQSGSGTSTNGVITFKSGTTTLGNIGNSSGYWTFIANSSVSGFNFAAGGTSQIIKLNASDASGIIQLITPSIQFQDTSGITAATLTPNSSGTTTFQFASTVTASTIKQADLTTNSGTGATLTIQAQNETGTTSTGGKLTLTSGTGTTAAGDLQLQIGGTNGARLLFDTGANHNAFEWQINTVQWAAASTAPIITQVDKTTNGGTGANLTIQAQNETGTTSIGGNLVLQSGTGTSTNGNITFKAGSVALGTFTTATGHWFTTLDSALGGYRVFANGASQFVQLSSTHATGAIFFDTATQNWRDSSSTQTITWLLNSAGTTSQTISAGVTAFTLSQADKTANNGAGNTFTIQAQNETGTTSTGGKLALTSGTGTTVAGNVEIQTGGTARLTVSPTAIIAGVSITGYEQVVSIAVGTSNASSTITLTTSQIVTRCRVLLNQAYSANATISVGQSGHTTDYQATTDNNPLGSVGDIYDKEQVTTVASNAAVLVTVGGSPVAGSCTVLVWYVVANT